MAAPVAAAAAATNPYTLAAIIGGGQLLGGLGEFFGGAGQRKRQEGIFNQLGGFSSQLSGLQGRLNPQNLFAQSTAASQPFINRLGGQLDQKFGFDQGRSGGELSRLLSERLSAMMPKFQQQSAKFDLNALMNAARVTAQQGQFT